MFPRRKVAFSNRDKTFHLRFDNRRNMESAVYSPTKDVDGLTSKTFMWGTSSMTQERQAGLHLYSVMERSYHPIKPGSYRATSSELSRQQGHPSAIPTATNRNSLPQSIVHSCTT